MESAKDQEQALITETRWLMSLSPEDRVEYVNNVIQSLADSIKQIATQKSNLDKLKLAQQLFEEINDKATTLMPPIIYCIKPEFQPTFIRLLKEFAAMI